MSPAGSCMPLRFPCGYRSRARCARGVGDPSCSPPGLGRGGALGDGRVAVLPSRVLAPRGVLPLRGGVSVRERLRRVVEPPVRLPVAAGARLFQGAAGAGVGARRRARRRRRSRSPATFGGPACGGRAPGRGYGPSLSPATSRPRPRAAPACSQGWSRSSSGLPPPHAAYPPPAGLPPPGGSSVPATHRRPGYKNHRRRRRRRPRNPFYATPARAKVRAIVPHSTPTPARGRSPPPRHPSAAASRAASFSLSQAARPRPGGIRAFLHLVELRLLRPAPGVCPSPSRRPPPPRWPGPRPARPPRPSSRPPTLP